VNEYTGSTVVAAGRMELARVGGRSIPDTMILTQSGVHTIVAILAPENISNTAIVSLFDGAELRVDANEAIGRLDVGAT
jgi:hypothetical protein